MSLSCRSSTFTHPRSPSAWFCSVEPSMSEKTITNVAVGGQPGEIGAFDLGPGFPHLPRNTQGSKDHGASASRDTSQSSTAASGTVGPKALWPWCCRRLITRFQTDPSCHDPWTETKVDTLRYSSSLGF